MNWKSEKALRLDGGTVLRRWLARVIAFAGGIGAITVIVGAGIYIGHTYHEKFLWRNDEYTKLQSLKAGFGLSYFESVLGPPVFSRTRKSGYTESTFRGHGYWIQSLSARGIVKLYAITACERGFHPSFTVPGSGQHIDLNRSTFANAGATLFDYRFAGAIISSYYYEAAGGADANYLKYYLWGINDACPNWTASAGHLGYRVAPGREYRGMTSTNDPLLQQFRHRAIVNTFAETAPGAFIVHYERRQPSRPSSFVQFHGFQIGVDRLLVRTTE